MRHVTLGFALSLILAAPALAQSADMPRAAHGDVTQPGGARRLSRDTSASYRALAAADDAKARNVILFIGDGMGDSEITVARNYAEGAGGFFKGIDALPVTGQYTHYSLDKATGKPSYVTDSAASGTAWSTGVKTYNNAVGVDIHGKPHKTLIELARAAGIGTGNVTTSELQDATPAVQIAHVALRKCYGPEETLKNCPADALENGGLGSITEQLLTTRPDVTLGGGAATFAETAKAGEYAGRTLAQQADARGYRHLHTAPGLWALRGGVQRLLEETSRVGRAATYRHDDWGEGDVADALVWLGHEFHHHELDVRERARPL